MRSSGVRISLERISRHTCLLMTDARFHHIRIVQWHTIDPHRHKFLAFLTIVRDISSHKIIHSLPDVSVRTGLQRRLIHIHIEYARSQNGVVDNFCVGSLCIKNAETDLAFCIILSAVEHRHRIDNNAVESQTVNVRRSLVLTTTRTESRNNGDKQHSYRKHHLFHKDVFLICK